MLLQKRTLFEHRRWIHGSGEREMRTDPLFEEEWDIFVVQRDPETGEFVTKTVAAQDAVESE